MNKKDIGPQRAEAPCSATYGFRVKSFSEPDRTVDIIVSTSAIDADGEVVVQDWDLDRYRKNPVVLWAHNLWDKPIGFAKTVGIAVNPEDGTDELVATFKFVTAAANTEAEEVWQGVVQGSIRACSPGFNPGAVDVATIDGQTVFLLSKNELIEISMCAVPCNPDAVAARRAFLQKSFDANASSNGRVAKETSMKSVLKSLGLSESATEAEAVAAVSEIGSKAAAARVVEKSVLDLTGAKSIDEATGTIAAWKESHAQLATEKAKAVTLEKQIAKQELDTIITKGVDEKKLTPAMKAWAETQSLETVKSFLATAPVVAALGTEAPKQPTAATTTNNGGPVDVTGKKWSDLTSRQKAALHQENRPLYDALKSAFEAERGGAVVGTRSSSV